jgi:hypothetical protein
VSQNERKQKEIEGKYEYQNLHNGAPLMVHSNPYFKYPKDVKSKMPSRKRKIKNPSEKEGNVLFLNKSAKRTPYKSKALSRVKSELNTLRTATTNRSK